MDSESDTQRQKPHTRRKTTEREVPIIKYPTLHRICRIRENLRLSATSNSTDLASRTGDTRCVHRTTPERHLHQQPKLFTATFEGTFRRLTWKTRCSKTDGKYRSQLRFADDILICANIRHELQPMLQEQTDETEIRV